MAVALPVSSRFPGRFFPICSRFISVFPRGSVPSRGPASRWRCFKCSLRPPELQPGPTPQWTTVSVMDL